LGATIKALQTRGLVEILAEPNVLAINGKEASFLAGGQFPYPILQGGGAGLGAVTIAFHDFGVRIDFLPLITPRGTIILDVAPEVSALDYANGLNFQGAVVPGLTTRRVKTEIELESGQSFAIGGLLDRRLQETIAKIPLLASVPLLGKLFQSRSREKQNTELLVIVTPEIVQPIPQGKPLPHLENPVPLGGSDVQPRTPGMTAAGTGSVSNPMSAIPVEKLKESIMQQSSMKIQNSKDAGMGPSELPLPMPVAPPPAPIPQAPAPQASVKQ
jgi:pilus assembly protein CpaC